MSSPAHIVVMGVSGSGKTTIAAELSRRLGWLLAEADEFHPQANIDKMSAGIPLTDEDRWPWLRTIRDWMAAAQARGESTVVTCSALKRSYRDLLSEAGGVVFLDLEGAAELIAERMKHRSGHFMPPALLESQLATLEPLEPDENGVRISVNLSPEEIASEFLRSEAFRATRER